MARAPELADFTGRWSLERSIQDKRNRTRGRLTGEASFETEERDMDPARTALTYRESGQLTLDEAPSMLATRNYLWRQGAGRIDVLFEDGREFHSLAADLLMPDDTHHCAPDLYHVSYDFTRWPRWSSTWRVVGPAKDYRICSEFRRRR